MKIKRVSDRKMDAIIRRNISWDVCPICGSSSVDIVIQLRWYGTIGAKAVCRDCGRSTRTHPINEALDTAGHRFATPITNRSLMRGVFSALNEWGRPKKELKQEVESNV